MSKFINLYTVNIRILLYQFTFKKLKKEDLKSRKRKLREKIKLGKDESQTKSCGNIQSKYNVVLY